MMVYGLPEGQGPSTAGMIWPEPQAIIKPS